MRIQDVSGNRLHYAQLYMHDDGHYVPAITHVVTDNDQVIGAFSVSAAPVLFFWMHTTRAMPIHCFKAFRQAESILRDAGHENPILIIERSSPFYPFLQRLGYGISGKAELFTKS